MIQYIDIPPHLLARGGGCNDSLLCEPRDSSYWNSRMLYIRTAWFNMWCGSLSHLPSGMTPLVRDPLVKDQFLPVTHMEPSVVLQNQIICRKRGKRRFWWALYPTESLPPQLHNSLHNSLEFFGKNRIDHNSAISWPIELKFFVGSLQCSRVQMIVKHLTGRWG